MKRTHVQLTEEQFEALRVLAFQERRSIADLVREAVEKYLAEQATKEESKRK